MNNKGYFIGEIKKGFTFSHETMKEKFFKSEIEISRKSGAQDVLPVIVSEDFLKMVEIPSRVIISGQVRSYNRNDGARHKLELFIFADSIYPANREDEDINEVELFGYLCKEPIYRETPLGKEICDMMVAVNRNSGNKSDYLPVIAWGRTAVKASLLEVSNPVHIFGRFQSREYTKRFNDGTQEIRTAYEVSAYRMYKEEPDAETEC